MSIFVSRNLRKQHFSSYMMKVFPRRQRASCATHCRIRTVPRVLTHCTLADIQQRFALRLILCVLLISTAQEGLKHLHLLRLPILLFAHLRNVHSMVFALRTKIQRASVRLLSVPISPLAWLLDSVPRTAPRPHLRICLVRKDQHRRGRGFSVRVEACILTREPTEQWRWLGARSGVEHWTQTPSEPHSSFSSTVRWPVVDTTTTATVIDGVVCAAVADASRQPNLHGEEENVAPESCFVRRTSNFPRAQRQLHRAFAERKCLVTNCDTTSAVFAS